jgi:hypothetical protein
MVIEAVLQARNIQRKEAHAIGAAWSRLKAIWSREPQMGRSKVGLDLLKSACPELVRAHPVEPLIGHGLVKKNSALKEEKLDCLKLFKMPVHESFAGVPWEALVKAPPREYWEHNGVCQCGKRTYLFGQCPNCLQQESLDRAEEVLKGLESKEQEVVPPGEGEVSVESKY